MNSMRRRIAAVLVVAFAFAMPLPVVGAPAPSVAPTAIVPTAVTTVDLKAVSMVSDTVGYAAGASGTIIKTTDGGSSWVKLTTGTTTADFRGIAFWSATTGVAVTYNRAVYRTIDGGATWTVANADMTDSVLGAPEIGVNGVTTVPGSSTSALLFGGTRPGDGFYVAEQAWRAGTGGGYWGNSPVVEPKRHLTDDGLGTITQEGEGEFLGVDFFDSTHGWLVGDDLFPNEDQSTVYASTDGGYAWSRQTFAAALRLTGVAFGSLNDGVIVSDVGRVFYTDNGGTAWAEGSSPVGTSINGVGMSSAADGWAVGAGGALLRTTNGGVSWASASSPTGVDLTAISLSGTTRGIAVGAGGTIIFTTDGTTWSKGDTGGAVDTTPPTTPVITSSTHPSQTSWYNTTDAIFTWLATDAVGVTGYSYVLDTSANTRPAETSMGSVTTTSVVLTEGTHYIHVIARDAVNNWSVTPGHRKVQIDLTKPVTSDNHVANYTGGIAQITLTPTDMGGSGISKTEWAVTGTAASSGTGTSVNVTGAGTYSLTYASTDAAGNKEATSAPVAFTIAGDPPPVEFVPIQGDNRYTTAVEASKLAFPTTAPAVVIATGSNWPDALGGAALAGTVGGPILLTDPKTLPSAVRTEIDRLNATTAYVLGSETAVSKAVADAVASIPGVTVERIQGSNRYTTADAVAAKVKQLNTGYDGTMFVATGTNFPDALAASPLSAANGWPLYLAAPTGLSQATLNAMKAGGSKVIILGSKSAVPTLVENQLKAAFPGAVIRLEGADRYGTGIAIANYGVSDAGLDWSVPALATGTNFPDALAGGVLQGLDGSILLLTNGTTLTPAVGTALGAHKAAIREVRYLGSTSAISSSVRTAVQNIVQ